MSLLQFTPIIRLLREMCCYNLELQLERQLDRARAADLVERIEAAVCTARTEAARQRCRRNSEQGIGDIVVRRTKIRDG